MVSSDFSQTPPICSNGKTEARFSGCDLVGVEHADGGDRRGGQGDRGDVGQGDGAREVNTAGETDAAGTDLGDTAVRAPICRAVPAKSSLVDDRPSDRSMPTPAHPRGQVMGHSLMDPKRSSDPLTLDIGQHGGRDVARTSLRPVRREPVYLGWQPPSG